MIFSTPIKASEFNPKKKSFRELDDVPRLIPFWLATLFVRFISDEERELAKLKYYYQGETYSRLLAKMVSKTEVELKRKLLSIDFDNNKISKSRYDKEIATINEEPYVVCLQSDFDKDAGVNGFSFDLDWNDQFVILLRGAGYTGINDEEIVKFWFDDVCRAVQEENEEAFESMPTIPGQPHVSKEKDKDTSKTRYS